MTNQPARGMHTGQIWHERDWDHLHIGNVDVTADDQVAFTVVELGDMLLHRAGSAMLDLDEPAPSSSTSARFWDGPQREDWTVRIAGQVYDVNDVPDAGGLL